MCAVQCFWTARRGPCKRLQVEDAIQLSDVQMKGPFAEADLRINHHGHTKKPRAVGKGVCSSSRAFVRGLLYCVLYVSAVRTRFSSLCMAY